MILQRLVHITAAMAVLLANNASWAQDEWALAKDADGIKVFVRKAAGSPLREFRGEASFKTTPEDIVKLLRDADSFRRWMPDVVESRLLKATDTEQLHYLEYKAPWPVSNRDGIYRFTYAKGSRGSVTVHVEALPDYLPLKKDKVRIPKATGQWHLVPGADGVRVSYQLLASPGGSIPQWLADQSAVEIPYGTLKAMGARLQGTP